MTRTPIAASSVRFIKLGQGGDWEHECIEGVCPCIRIGFHSNQHLECLAGNWGAVSKYWATTGGKTKGKATEFTNQIKTFYTADERTLWITFHRRKLWWCFASATVEELPCKDRIRRTLGEWSCKDIHGHELHIDDLSGVLTKVQGFRGTICAVSEPDYVLRRLNGNLPIEVAHATTCLRNLESAIEPLIRKLGWKDFELLCDLVFTRAGWQRVSALGKTEKTVDMVLQSPVSRRRALVQIKSQANLSTFLEYKAGFEQIGGYDETYFVVHSPNRDLETHQPAPGAVLLTADRLAPLIVSAGLTGWLIDRTS